MKLNSFRHPFILHLFSLLSFRAMHLIALLWLFKFIFASSGDESTLFMQCTRKCKSTVCLKPPPLPLSLYMTFWDCPQNCNYDCMHAITDEAIQNNQKVHQYFGKWPFYRLWGVQEPASVLFSILNGIGHYVPSINSVWLEKV